MTTLAAVLAVLACAPNVTVLKVCWISGSATLAYQHYCHEIQQTHHANSRLEERLVSGDNFPAAIGPI